MVPLQPAAPPNTLPSLRPWEPGVRAYMQRPGQPLQGWMQVSWMHCAGGPSLHPLMAPGKWWRAGTHRKCLHRLENTPSEALGKSPSPPKGQKPSPLTLPSSGGPTTTWKPALAQVGATPSTGGRPLAGHLGGLLWRSLPAPSLQTLRSLLQGASHPLAPQSCVRAPPAGHGWGLLMR